MKLFMFRFSDRPYGGQFVAIIHNSEEEALELALKRLIPDHHPQSMKDRWRKDFVEYRTLFVDDAVAPVEVGAVVSGSYEE